MLGSLTCHYITRQITVKNSFPYSLHPSKHYIQSSHKYTRYLAFFFPPAHTFGHIQMLSPPYRHPLPTSSRWCFGTSRRRVTPPGEPRGPLGLLSMASSQIPDDTCEPWQSSWYTVAVSGLLCQTKHRHNVFSLTVPQQTPHRQKWLRPTFSRTQSGSASFLQSYATVNTASESVFFSPCQRVLISSECQGCLPGSTSFLSEPNPFLVLCNIVPHCPSTLINILHAQHLWSVFHCSSSGETSVAALQMDIGASPETIRFPHTTSLTCVLKTPDLDHLRLERKLPEHKAGALVYTLKHIIALLSLQVEGLL